MLFPILWQGLATFLFDLILWQNIKAEFQKKSLGEGEMLNTWQMFVRWEKGSTKSRIWDLPSWLGFVNLFFWNSLLRDSPGTNNCPDFWNFHMFYCIVYNILVPSLMKTSIVWKVAFFQWSNKCITCLCFCITVFYILTSTLSFWKIAKFLQSASKSDKTSQDAQEKCRKNKCKEIKGGWIKEENNE